MSESSLIIFWLFMIINILYMIYSMNPCVANEKKEKLKKFSLFKFNYDSTLTFLTVILSFTVYYTYAKAGIYANKYKDIDSQIDFKLPVALFLFYIHIEDTFLNKCKIDGSDAELILTENTEYKSLSTISKLWTALKFFLILDLTGIFFIMDQGMSLFLEVLSSR